MDSSKEAAADRAGSKDVRPSGGVDDLDRRILDVLQDDARMTNAELAAALGVAPSEPPPEHAARATDADTVRRATLIARTRLRVVIPT